MKLLFKQRFFSWLDSYDIYDENNNVVFEVKGELSWGHKLKIYDKNGIHIGTVKEEIFAFLSKFNLYLYDQYVGQIKKELTFFKPSFILDCNNWHVEGNFFEWDYQIIDNSENVVAIINKQLFNLTDIYQLEIFNPDDAIYVLMIALAIDAQKCSRDRN
ncbi:LURP-one-related family protein [uncultured Thomasclavelia sp.]|uniref:LURP-one-related/scramblase family protein n=1 Tax=uncultured Thomasclavelia sp. TaxID=3025759 RepID=UPI002606398E|nr:LURP-one-related family protein [uncultured Thomasclavelia sp.]